MGGTDLAQRSAVPAVFQALKGWYLICVGLEDSKTFKWLIEFSSQPIERRATRKGDARAKIVTIDLQKWRNSTACTCAALKVQDRL